MLTGRSELIDEARIWNLHGMNRDAWKRYGTSGSWYYEVIKPGYKYNMSDIQAALGLIQLKRLEELQARRYAIVQQYTDAFAQFPEVETPTCRPNVKHAWHLYILRLNLDKLKVDRAQFIEELKARNIGTSVHFIPLFIHPYYAQTLGVTPEDFPVTYAQYQRTISLPLYPLLSDEDVQDVISAVADVIETTRW